MTVGRARKSTAATTKLNTSNPILPALFPLFLLIKFVGRGRTLVIFNNLLKWKCRGIVSMRYIKSVKVGGDFNFFI